MSDVNRKVYLTGTLLNEVKSCGLNIQTVDELHHFFMKEKIDVIPTFSQFSRTYGYRVYYIVNGETKEINNRFSKFDYYDLALYEGLIEAMRIYKNQKECA